MSNGRSVAARTATVEQLRPTVQRDVSLWSVQAWQRGYGVELERSLSWRYPILLHYDLAKVRAGDIVVSVMTNATYTPVLARAGAIFTDEGGVTCHAAILARERRIPCVVGTANATRVLKDGDLVEVDAEKGIVRVLRRARNLAVHEWTERM